MTKSHTDDVEDLREQWKELYTKTLPKLAKANDPAQSKWPVSLDHCFARIILDNTIGQGQQQWDKVISKPAVKHMTVDQFNAAIDLGEKIQSGAVNLVDLDRQSLLARGKNEGKYKFESGTETANKDGKDTDRTVKRKREDQIEKPDSPKKTKSTQATLSFGSDQKSKSQLEKSLEVTSTLTPELMKTTLKRIDDSTITPFRKRLYTSLLSVPKGQYTTYAALADHLGSAARAVGNGMRNNPFAPDVPCHRVLASDGTLGGFFGEWSRDKGPKGYMPKQIEKVQLLQKEGVHFDSSGKVKGPLWRAFWDRGDFLKEVEK